MKNSFHPWNPRRWFFELRHVWQDTRLIVLTAQIAAIYAAILIPFKVGIPLIPGFAELRPANAIPIVTSLLFGPAAVGSSISGYSRIVNRLIDTTPISSTSRLRTMAKKWR